MNISTFFKTKQISFLLAFFLLFSTTVFSAELTISKASSTPVIDGDISDWPDTWVNMDLTTTFSTSFSMTAKFQMKYDSNNLYFVAVVVDETPNNDEVNIPSYFRDCIEFFISMDTSRGDGSYKEGVWQVRKQRSPESGGIDGNYGLEGGGNSWSVSPLLENTNFKAISNESSYQYIVEMQLPWNVLTFNMSNWDKKQFAFDVSASDNSDGSNRTQMNFWNNNSDTQWKNTNSFGLVYLEEPIEGTIETPSNTILLNKSGSYKINTITSFFDSGGEFGAYEDGENYTMTIYPEIPGKKVKVSFSQFELETCCDYLSIYDGIDENAPLLGTYKNSIPDEFTASNNEGALTFVFFSDGSVTYSGFKALLNPTDININPSVVELASFDTIYKVEISAKNYSWTVTENYNWLSVSDTIGTNDGNFTINSLVNTSNLNRNAFLNIIFTDSAGTITTIQLPVNQSAPDNELSLPFSEIEIPWNIDSAFSFQVNSNTSWYTSYSSHWFYLNYSDNYGNQAVTVTANKNPFINSRYSKVTFYWYDKVGSYRSKDLYIRQGAAKVGVENKSLTFNAGKDTISLSVVSDSISWNISSNVKWINLSPRTGLNDTSVTLIAEANPWGDERYAKVKFTYTENGKRDSIIIDVTQERGQGWLECPDTLYLTGNQFTPTILNVRTNTQYYNWVMEGNWINTDYQTRDSFNYNLKIYSYPNPYIYSRQTIIKLEWYDFYSGWNTKYVYIIQQAAEIGVSSTYLTLSSKEGSSTNFNIKTNGTGWNIVCDENWLTIDPMSGSNDATINLVASGNTSASTRSTYVYFKALEGNINKVEIPIEVVQYGVPPILATTKDRIDLNEEVLSDTFSIISNTDWNIYTSWGINLEYNGVSFGNKTIRVYPDFNFKGLAYIYIDWYDGNNSISKSIPVNISREGENPINYLTIYKLNQAPSIDGRATSNEVWSLLPGEKIEKTNNQISEISANFKMTYDDDFVYVLVAVNDKTPKQDGQESWQSDCVELFFAMDTTSDRSYTYGDWQLRKVASKSQFDGGIDGIANNLYEMLNQYNFIVKQTDSDSSYTQEWQIPISILNMGANSAWPFFRFDVQVADNNGNGFRSGQLFWNSAADNQWNYIQNHGYVKFGPNIDSLKSEIRVNQENFANVLIFPNPAVEILQIKSGSIVKSVSIYSLDGKLMLESGINKNQAVLDIKSLNQGVYITKIILLNGKNVIQRLIKK